MIWIVITGIALVVIVAGVFAYLGFTGKLPSIMTPDGRRAWSFMSLQGGAFIFTVFAAIALYLVSGNEFYSFWLGIAAHVQLLLIIGVFGAQFVKRTIKVSRDSVEVSDTTIHEGDTVSLTKE